MTDATSLPLRSEVPAEQTWDLASVFPTPKDWEDACTQLASKLPDLSVYHGHLAENPLTLLQYIQAFQDAATLMGKISLYANKRTMIPKTRQYTLNQENLSFFIMLRRSFNVK